MSKSNKKDTKGGKKGALDDLDNILDAALDDFEKEELAEKARNEAAKKAQKQTNDLLAKEAQKMADLENVKKMMDGLNDPRFGHSIQSTLKSLSSTADGIENVDDLFHTIHKQFDVNNQVNLTAKDANDAPGIQKADKEIAATLSMLSQAQSGMEGFEASKLEEVGESMMEDMISQFETLGEKEDYNEVIDGVIRQLLSKDLMYEPTKQICEKFPEWLALHKPNLSDTEYNNYGRQYMTFQKLLAVYDTEPDNFPRLMELMFDMQAFGQPPADIIKDLAPGLKFDENGMPIMPNMGAGMMPEGGEGMPQLGELAHNMATGQCSIC
jgi:peroxin-19